MPLTQYIKTAAKLKSAHWSEHPLSFHIVMFDQHTQNIAQCNTTQCKATQCEPEQCGRLQVICFKIGKFLTVQNEHQSWWVCHELMSIRSPSLFIHCIQCKCASGIDSRLTDSEQWLVVENCSSWGKCSNHVIGNGVFSSHIWAMIWWGTHFLHTTNALNSMLSTGLPERFSFRGSHFRFWWDSMISSIHRELYLRCKEQSTWLKDTCCHAVSTEN